MTVYAQGTVNPETIVSGESLRVFHNSYGVGEVIIYTDVWINEFKTGSLSSGSRFITVASANTNFIVGETVLFGAAAGGFLTNTNYYVITTSATQISLSLTLGGSPVYATATTTGNIYKGCVNTPYPTIFPYPVTSAAYRTIYLDVTGSGGGSAPHTSTAAIQFYTQLSYSTKPTKFSVFDRISIFIYSPHPTASTGTATIINRNSTPNHGFIYTDLKFTDSINKAGTATFTITARGTQTTAEEALLLSDNYVAIIAGESVVWSGKILRSEQSVMSLFASSSNVKQWEIECETDISKMRTQNIKSANKGTHTGSIGYIVSKLVENDVSGDVNWNGTTNDPALRSDEGPKITYTITEVDMFNQIVSLRNVIALDMRTRLVYQRYHYNSFAAATSTFTVTSTTPYSSPDFVGKWVIVIPSTTRGVTSYGKCASQTTTRIVCDFVTNNTLPDSTGTIVIIGEPVLDLVSDLSQPSAQANFRGNTIISSTYSSGYEFNDKTDRKTLATKVVARGKTFTGSTIASSVAAVTPWNQSVCSFENSTTITKRREGTVIAVDTIASGAEAGRYFTLEGWGYPTISSATYPLNRWWAFKTVGGTWRQPTQYTYLLGVPVETYSGSKRVTVFRLLYSPIEVNIGDLAICTNVMEEITPIPPIYGYIYIKSPTELGYTPGMIVYIGGERIQTVDLSLDPVDGYRVRYYMDGTALHREATSSFTAAHSTGSTIWKDSVYSETSPVPGSPVNYHGIILQTYTPDQTVFPEILEMYSSMFLIANSYYNRKASFWCMMYDFYKTDSREQYQLTSASLLGPGDRIAFLQKSTDSTTQILYGQLRNIWQIVSLTVDANTLQVFVELGDFERNVFTLLADKTAAINATIT